MLAFLLLATGAFLVGLAKGGLPGVGNLTIAIYASVLDAKASVGILLPILIAGDIIAITVYRHHAVWKYVWKLAAWMLVGIGIGYATMHMLTSSHIQRIIGAIILLMASLQLARKWQRRHEDQPDELPHHLAFQGSLGIIGGFATMVANGAGPTASLYFASIGLSKLAFVGTAAWCFFILNLVKVPLMMDIGILSGDSLQISLRYIPFAIAGALLAPFILKHINESTFSRLVWIFIILAGLKLLWA